MTDHFSRRASACRSPAAWSRRTVATAMALGLGFTAPSPAADSRAASTPPRVQHVLLISIDGLHASDLQRYVRTHPRSALAALSAHGETFTQARTPAPADSFPGLLALVTGGTPAATGVYYDVTYDRALSPPGSDCKQLGTVVRYDESIDLPAAPHDVDRIDPARLPRDPRHGCAPVWPHQFLRVNTVFDVAHDAGLYTAWADKHPAYDIVQGPAGHGVADLDTPEIGDNFRGKADAEADKITASIERTAAYDRMKAQAVLNEIDGLSHDGRHAAPVPALFGMNVQAVSVGQKRGGYLDADGRPSPALARALDDSDSLIGDLIRELDRRHLRDSTLVVVTAKHGNAPVDSARLRHIPRHELLEAVRAAAGQAPAQLTADDIALVWFAPAPPRPLQSIIDRLNRQSAVLGIARVETGSQFSGAAADSRTPDLVLIPRPGVIYAHSGDDKRAEHGGISDDDRHVAMLLSNPVLFPQPRQAALRVSTTQLAPTMLDMLGLNPRALRAVRQQSVPELPDLR